MSKSNKPILPIMLDIETLGLAANAAPIDIAMKTLYDNEPPFQVQITPEAYAPEDSSFEVTQKTVDFHGPEKLARYSAQGISPRRAAAQVANYLGELAKTYEIHLWCQGKDFDVPVLANFLTQHDQKTFWHYRNTHCLRDIAALYGDVARNSWGNHTAMKDVEHQCKHLLKLMSYSLRIQEFVLYGKVAANADYDNGGH